MFTAHRPVARCGSGRHQKGTSWLLKRGLAAVIASGIAAGFLVAAHPQSARAATGCPNVLVIGARGSGEPDQRSTAGMGPEVYAFYQALSAELKGKLTAKSLQVVYTAADVKILYPTKKDLAAAAAAVAAGPAAIAAFLALYKINHVDPFVASIQDGIQSALDELRTEAQQCPATRFVMAGFSQGAMVMHQLLLRLDDQNHDTLLGRIADAVLIADGDKVKERGLFTLLSKSAGQ